MAQLTLLRGLPGSGKTPYARRWVDEAPNRIRVNRDDLRMMMVGGALNFPREFERVVTAAEVETVAWALGSGIDVLVDATNLDPYYYDVWAEHCDPDMIAWLDFPRPLESLLATARLKSGWADKEHVIRDMFANFTLGDEAGTLKPVPPADDWGRGIEGIHDLLARPSIFEQEQSGEDVRKAIRYVMDGE